VKVAVYLGLLILPINLGVCTKSVSTRTTT
jgi:hypothetical protein